MKIEIEIPPQYAEILKEQAAEQNTTVDDITEKAIKNLIERNEKNAGE